MKYSERFDVYPGDLLTVRLDGHWSLSKCPVPATEIEASTRQFRTVRNDLAMVLSESKNKHYIMVLWMNGIVGWISQQGLGYV